MRKVSGLGVGASKIRCGVVDVVGDLLPVGLMLYRQTLVFKEEFAHGLLYGILALSARLKAVELSSSRSGKPCKAAPVGRACNGKTGGGGVVGLQISR